METTIISQTLLRLRQAADIFAAAWPTTRWTKISGPGPDTFDQEGSGNFKGLTFQPGQDVTLATRLMLPAEVEGVPISGEPLEATIASLYPAEITWEEEPVFSEGGVPVAAGPALITVINAGPAATGAPPSENTGSSSQVISAGYKLPIVASRGSPWIGTPAISAGSCKRVARVTSWPGWKVRPLKLPLPS